MSTAQTTALALPATKRPSLITSMAGKYNIEPAKLLETLKETILPKASDAEMQAFCIVAHEYDLNPFLKEIHAFPNKSGGITPVVGVDGWCSLMNRRPDFDGIEFDIEDQDGKPYSVTASIYIKGRSRPVRVTEYHSECARNTDPWRQSPRRMLRHRALIQAARVAFGFSGIMDEEDAVKLAVVTDVQTVPEAKPVFGKIAAPKADAVAATVPEVVKESAPAAAAPKSPQEQLADIVTGAGFTFDQWQAWAIASGFTKTEVDGFESVSVALANRLIKSQADMLAAMKEVAK